MPTYLQAILGFLSLTLPPHQADKEVAATRSNNHLGTALMDLACPRATAGMMAALGSPQQSAQLLMHLASIGIITHQMQLSPCIRSTHANVTTSPNDGFPVSNEFTSSIRRKHSYYSASSSLRCARNLGMKAHASSRWEMHGSERFGAHRERTGVLMSQGGGLKCIRRLSFEGHRAT
jgi:hypothetical protein